MIELIPQKSAIQRITLSGLIQVLWKEQTIFDENPFALFWGKENFVGRDGLNQNQITCHTLKPIIISLSIKEMIIILVTPKLKSIVLPPLKINLIIPFLLVPSICMPACYIVEGISNYLSPSVLPLSTFLLPFLPESPLSSLSFAWIQLWFPIT